MTDISPYSVEARPKEVPDSEGTLWSAVDHGPATYDDEVKAFGGKPEDMDLDYTVRLARRGQKVTFSQLSPDSADELADQLRASAQEVRARQERAQKPAGPLLVRFGEEGIQVTQIPAPDRRGEDLYDEQGNYRYADLVQGSHHVDDPAWPGVTPEPEEMHEVLPGMVVPCARSFIENVHALHRELIHKMLDALPERRLTRVVGYGNLWEGGWRAFNEGPDGHGDWAIPRNLAEVAKALNVETAR